MLRSFLRRPQVAASALVLAALAWGGVVYQQGRGTSVQEQLALGIRLASAGDGRAAEGAWYEAIRLDPKNADAWELLAGFYQSTGNTLGVTMALQQLQSLRPGMPHLRARLAESLFKTGDEARALTLARAELTEEPDCKLALQTAADVLKKEGGTGKLLLGYARRLTELEPENLTYLLFYAETLATRGHYKEATPFLERILKLSPNNTSAYGMRGAAHFESSSSPASLKAAEADLLQALRYNPVFPLPRLYLGKVYRRQGRLSEAITQFEEAVRLLPNTPQAYFELSSAYRQAKRNDDAKRALTTFETLRRAQDEQSRLQVKAISEPNNGPLHHKVGMLLFKKGDFHRAGNFFKVALSLNPNDKEAREAMEKILAKDGVGNPKAMVDLMLNQVKNK